MASILNATGAILVLLTAIATSFVIEYSSLRLILGAMLRSLSTSRQRDRRD
jgi:hypothetical protein